MDISILICTYDRAEALRLTLEVMRKLIIPEGLEWEIIIVDNALKDHTPEVVSSFDGKLPVRYLSEKEQGKSRALNRGLKDCKATWVMMTDDDVDVDPGWMAELHRAAQAHPDFQFFGGRIKPRWTGTPPAWMTRHSDTLLRGVTLDFNMGEAEMALKKNAEPFVGANVAYRTDVLRAIGSFREDLGPDGRSLRYHEETELIERLHAAGFRGMYLPRMIVNHRNPPERMTEKYTLRWFVGRGRSDVRMGYIEPARATLFGAPRYLWRNLIGQTLKYLATRWVPSPDDKWLLTARSMAVTWGAIIEYRRMNGEHAHNG